MQLSQEEKVVQMFLTENDCFEYAIVNSEVFQNYWASLSDEEQIEVMNARGAQNIPNMRNYAEGVRTVLYIAAGPLGWLILIIKWIAKRKIKQSREKSIAEIVESDYFNALFISLTNDDNLSNRAPQSKITE